MHDTKGPESWGRGPLRTPVSQCLLVLLLPWHPGASTPEGGTPDCGLRGWGRMQLSPSEGYVGGLGEEQERWRWVTEQVGVTLRA